jgi:hypothetical protein
MFTGKLTLSKIKIIILSVVTLFVCINFSAMAQQKIDWNGYLQYRFSDNYLDRSNFSVRRAKFWVNGILPDNNGNWSYKIQANFLQQVKYQLLLQDILVRYKIKGFEVTAGQFVLDYGLQRKQPDYEIPLNERANVINALVPGAETMARDIGVELKLDKKNTGSFSLGFFNGNGANNITNQKNFLFVNRGRFLLLNNSESQLEMGYNLSYRNAHNLEFNKIFGSNSIFTGNDFRFGFEGKLNVGHLELQSEYLEAHLGNQKAYGFYAIADYKFAEKNIVTLSVKQLNDLNPSTIDNTWYIIGYSYLVKGNNIKLSIDNSFQFTSYKTNSLTTLQIQYFFNQK